MTVFLAPFFGAGYQSFLENGTLNSSGFINTYGAGGSTPQATWTSSTGAIANPTQIPLGSDGRPPNQMWFTAGLAYKIVIADSTNTPLPGCTFDNLYGINDPAFEPSDVTEWLPGLAPTYVSATSFTVAGNQTGFYQVNRRVQTVNSGGIFYGTIQKSLYTIGTPGFTTITMVIDLGNSLDSGLSAANPSFFGGTHPSIPLQIADQFSTVPISVPFSSTVTIAANQSNVFQIGTLTGNFTLAITSPTDGQQITVYFTQDGTGSRIATWPASFQWPANTPIPLSTAGTSVDILTASYRASTGVWYASMVKGYPGTAGGVLNQVISSNQTNYNIYIAAGSPLISSTVTVTVNMGVVIGSSSTSLPAMDTGTGWAAGSTITFVSMAGTIEGAGGSGGLGGTFRVTTGVPGSNGGIALNMQWPVTMTSVTGIIAGGAGGGGGGGWGGNGTVSNGGAGGGGAGVIVGPGGAGNDGTQTAGGTGNAGFSGGGYTGGAGGNGGNPGLSGSSGTTGTAGYAGSAGGLAGYAIKRNGNTCTGVADQPANTNGANVKGQVG